MSTKLSGAELAKVLERLRRLVALGGTESQDDIRAEEEARTSARLACKLIMKHEIGFSAPGESTTRVSGPATPKSGIDRAASAWRGIVDDAPGTQQAWGAMPKQKRPAEVVVEITARKQGECIVCNRLLGKGDRVAYHTKAKKIACLRPCGEMLRAGINL